MTKLLTTVAAGALLFGNAVAAPSIFFLIDGDTFASPFSVENSSDAGELVTRMFIDLSATDLFFDTVNGGVPNDSLAVPFTPTDGSEITTGQFFDAVVDGGKTLDVRFNDFDPMEAFTFDIDVDFVDVATVFGNEMIGALVFFEFSDGTALSGPISAVTGNPDAGQFTATGMDRAPEVPIPGAGILLGSAIAGFVARKRVKAAA